MYGISFLGLYTGRRWCWPSRSAQLWLLEQKKKISLLVNGKLNLRTKVTSIYIFLFVSIVFRFAFRRTEHPVTTRLHTFRDFIFSYFYATCSLSFSSRRFHLIVDFVTITFDLLADCVFKRKYGGSDPDKILLYLKPFQLSNLIYSKPVYTFDLTVPIRTNCFITRNGKVPFFFVRASLFIKAQLHRFVNNSFRRHINI